MGILFSGTEFYFLEYPLCLFLVFFFYMYALKINDVSFLVVGFLFSLVGTRKCSKKWEMVLCVFRLCCEVYSLQRRVVLILRGGLMHLYLWVSFFFSLVVWVCSFGRRFEVIIVQVSNSVSFGQADLSVVLVLYDRFAVASWYVTRFMVCNLWGLFYTIDVNPYCDPARKLADNKYWTIGFPFEPANGEVNTRPFEFLTQRVMDLDGLFTCIAGIIFEKPRRWESIVTLK